MNEEWEFICTLGNRNPGFSSALESHEHDTVAVGIASVNQRLLDTTPQMMQDPSHSLLIWLDALKVKPNVVLERIIFILSLGVADP